MADSQIAPPVWRVAAGDSAAEHDLVSALQLSPLLARLLVNRGVRTAPEATEFLNPVRRHLHSPFLFTQMERAVARLRRAIADGEKIFIFGDRDVDGMAGTAILRIVLTAFGADVDSHIPTGSEGYGVHPEVMARAIREGCTLGITVDTGIAEIERIEEAARAGMDVIVADHHQQKDTLPPAYAILHPAVPGETYPFKHLSGAGVAFKLAMALIAGRSPFANRTLVFVDVETTGLDRAKDEVIEIGAVKYRNGVRQSEFSCFVKPAGPLPEEIRRITGITDEDLAAHGIEPRTALKKLLGFLEGPDTVFCGYNVEFDRDFLDAELGRHLQTRLSTSFLDVMAVATSTLTELPSRKLSRVAEALGVVNPAAHRALSDAQATADVFYKLLERESIEDEVYYEQLMPLAALAAVADMMPLVGENRAIVAEGLRIMRHAPPIGLKRLLEKLALAEPTGKDLAFLLGPLLNAPGRLGDPLPAFRMLTTQSDHEAAYLSDQLIRMNEERKDLVKVHAARVMEMVPLQNNLDADRILCVRAEGVPPGVGGIVAARVKNAFARPVVIVMEEEGRAVGSARSIESLDLVEAVGTCADLLEKFGGHHQAVGLTIRPENIPDFFKRLKKSVAERLRDMPEPVLTIDAELQLGDLTMATLEDISVLEPFGKGNPFPRFALFGAPVADVRRIGADGRRLRLGATARDAVTAVGWNMSDDADTLGRRVNAAFELDRNEWQGRIDLQLVLEDVRPATERNSG